MNEICNNEYSLFSNITELQSANAKKEYIGLVKDFINVLSRLYENENVTEEIDEEQTQQFLVKVGVIKNIEDITLFKKIIGNEYQRIAQIGRAHV